MKNTIARTALLVLALLCLGGSLRAQNVARIYSGSGSPNGRVVAQAGDVYLDATNNVFYFKGQGSDANGWAQIPGSSGGSPGSPDQSLQIDNMGTFGGSAFLYSTSCVYNPECLTLPDDSYNSTNLELGSAIALVSTTPGGTYMLNTSSQVEVTNSTDSGVAQMGDAVGQEPHLILYDYLGGFATYTRLSVDGNNLTVSSPTGGSIALNGATTGSVGLAPGDSDSSLAMTQGGLNTFNFFTDPMVTGLCQYGGNANCLTEKFTVMGSGAAFEIGESGETFVDCQSDSCPVGESFQTTYGDEGFNTKMAGGMESMSILTGGDGTAAIINLGENGVTGNIIVGGATSSLAVEGLKSTTGQVFVCADDAGNFVPSATPCSGTL